MKPTSDAENAQLMNHLERTIPPADLDKLEKLLIEAKEIFDKPIGREVTVVVTISAVFILLFFVYPSPILIGAENAAAALFP